MEQVKKLEKRGGGGGDTTEEYVLFRGDAVLATEMNVVCLSGPVTGEQSIIVTAKMICSLPREKAVHYMIGKSVKLGFMMKDYCDRNGFGKTVYRFVFQKTSEQVAEDQTPGELGMRNGDVIVAWHVLRG